MCCDIKKILVNLQLCHLSIDSALGWLTNNRKKTGDQHLRLRKRAILDFVGERQKASVASVI